MKRGAIVAKRHLHIYKKASESLGLPDGCPVHVMVQSNDRSLIFGSVLCRVDNSEAEYKAFMHIDTDEGNAAGIARQAKGIILI